MKIKLIAFVFFSALITLSSFSIAQSITNITATQSGKNILVNYNLTGKEGITAYEIKLFVSPDGGSTWQGPLTAVTGDVGKGQAAANSKSITWVVLAESGFNQLKGDNIQFKIKAFYNKLGSSGDIEMVWVEGGSYLMGSNKGGEDEKPVHEVTLKGFYIGKYEVTQEQWQKLMGNNPSKFFGCQQCPVERVSWDEVQVFIKKLNTQTGKSYRLPTEAEWEYAAKGGNKNSSYEYSGSDNIDEVAWYGDANDKPHPIGTKKANVLGIFDMTGNVWEWCSDWYDHNYYQYSTKRNPEGALTGDYRVLRGGSFYGYANNCRPADRNSNEPYFRSYNIGFRLAQD
jgi:formylglycine-generating enzyme required for sulfatase activity